MITGYYVPTGGEIDVRRAGRSSTRRRKGKVRSKKPHEVTAMGIGRTFQNIRLFGAMSVLDNVRVGSQRSPGEPLVGRGRAEAEDAPRGAGRDRLGDGAARSWSTSTSASEWWARNLPYGDQRRLEIARALATRPKLLLLDEPTAGMNSSETREMTDFIRKLRARWA